MKYTYVKFKVRPNYDQYISTHHIHHYDYFLDAGNVHLYG